MICKRRKDMSVAKEQREKLIWEFPNIGKKAPEQEE